MKLFTKSLMCHSKKLIQKTFPFNPLFHLFRSNCLLKGVVARLFTKAIKQYQIVLNNQFYITDMDSIKAIFRKVKQLFSFNAGSSRAAMTMYRLSNMNVNRKAAKA